MKTTIEKSAAGAEIDGKKWHLWTSLSPSGGNPTAPEQFRAWGADELYEAGNDGPYRMFFLRAGGKWFYAHADGALSCYVATHRIFSGPTGEIAALEHLLSTRNDALEQAKNNVATMDRDCALIRDQITKARNRYNAT